MHLAASTTGTSWHCHSQASKNPWFRASWPISSHCVLMLSGSACFFCMFPKLGPPTCPQLWTVCPLSYGLHLCRFIGPPVLLATPVSHLSSNDGACICKCKAQGGFNMHEKSRAPPVSWGATDSEPQWLKRAKPKPHRCVVFVLWWGVVRAGGSLVSACLLSWVASGLID